MKNNLFNQTFMNKRHVPWLNIPSSTTMRKFDIDIRNSFLYYIPYPNKIWVVLFGVTNKNIAAFSASAFDFAKCATLGHFNLHLLIYIGLSGRI